MAPASKGALLNIYLSQLTCMSLFVFGPDVYCSTPHIALAAGRFAALIEPLTLGFTQPHSASDLKYPLSLVNLERGIG
jgi:hypothetical protein